MELTRPAWWPDRLAACGLRFGASATNQRALRLFGGSPAAIDRRLDALAGARPIRPDPALRGDDWVRVRPLLAGICGTDMSLLTGHASPILSPFASFPAVLGHEVVGVVEEAEREWPARVVVDPIICCCRAWPGAMPPLRRRCRPLLRASDRRRASRRDC